MQIRVVDFVTLRLGGVTDLAIRAVVGKSAYAIVRGLPVELEPVYRKLSRAVITHGPDIVESPEWRTRQKTACVSDSCV